MRLTTVLWVIVPERGLDGDCRCARRSEWDEDIARAGTTGEKAGGDHKDAEKTKEPDRTVLPE